MLFGALLVIGLVAGEAVRRYAALPRITGYVLAGAALGPHGTGLLSDNALFDLRLLVDLSIGLIVFELGSRLDFDWLKRSRWLFVTALAECLFSFWAIYAALAISGFRPLFAAMAAAIGTATSPAIVLLVAHELRAEERRARLCGARCVRELGEGRGPLAVNDTLVYGSRRFCCNGCCNHGLGTGFT